MLARARSLLTSAEVATPRTPALSPRELDVLRLLVAGHPDREIAERLEISPRTVQTHVAGLFSKLQAGSRAEAAAIAVRRGIA
jgi:DNA-binding NarL/FixJ family response regulator